METVVMTRTCRSLLSAIRPRRSIFAAAVVAIALHSPGCGCDPDPISEVKCEFSVEAQDGDLRLEYPQTAIGNERSRVITISNTGNRTLESFEFAWDEANATHYRVVAPDDFRVEVNGSEVLTVVFRPLAESPNLAASFTVRHSAVSGVGCPSFRVQVDGSAFEPIEINDAGPDAGEVDDAGPNPFDGGQGLIDAGVITPPDGGVTLPPGARFRARGAFQEGRAGFAAIPLDDGSVLAIGGYGENGQALDSIERFDPRTGKSRVVAHMAVPRAEPGAARIPTDGRVVIAGGLSAVSDGEALRLVEIYHPDDDTLSCPGAQDDCGLEDNAQGLLPVGRIDPLVVAFEPTGTAEVAVLLGRTLDDEGEEVPAAGGSLVPLAGAAAVTDLTGADALVPRTDEVRVLRRGDGAVLIAAGRTAAGAVLSDLAVLVPPLLQVATLTPATTPLTARAGAAGALLEDGDVLIAGGVNVAGFGVPAMERVLDPFADHDAVDVDVVAVDGIELTTRFGASLVTLPGDLVLLAGGLDRDPALLTASGSVVPRRDAELFVPFGAGGLLRVSPDNDLAVPRFLHRALHVFLPDETDGGDDADEDIVVFLGGSSVAPRRVPHSQAERFRLPRNAFEVWGLMGPGTAFAANAPAALYSVGGIDPHTGSLSTRVRAFDTVNDRFLDQAPLDEPRRDHSVTLLADQNTFVVVGGRDASGQVLASATIYNPFNDWAEPLPVALNRARAGHSSTLLPDGDVLLCGGQGAGGEALDTCEVFEPPSDLLDTDTYDEARFHLVTGRMSAGRVGHSATYLPDSDEVLLVGGGDVETDLVQADLYSVQAGEVNETGLPNRARRQHIAVHLGGGRVLIAGGETYLGGLTPTADAEVYVRANGAFVPVEDEMNRARQGGLGIALVNGDVLITGGARTGEGAFPTRSIALSELYVPGPTGIGEFVDTVDIPLTYARSDVAAGEVFGAGLAAGGTHRSGRLLSGDERQTPLYFVDELVNPDEEDGGVLDAGP